MPGTWDLYLSNGLSPKGIGPGPKMGFVEYFGKGTSRRGEGLGQWGKSFSGPPDWSFSHWYFGGKMNIYREAFVRWFITVFWKAYFNNNSSNRSIQIINDKAPSKTTINGLVCRIYSWYAKPHFWDYLRSGQSASEIGSSRYRGLPSYNILQQEINKKNLYCIVWWFFQIFIVVLTVFLQTIRPKHERSFSPDRQHCNPH